MSYRLIKLSLVNNYNCLRSQNRAFSGLSLRCVPSSANILLARRQIGVPGYVFQPSNDGQWGNLMNVRYGSSFSEKVTNFTEWIGLSWPVQRCTDALIWVHEFTGLPWWLSIILSTVMFRSLIVFPFMCYDRRIIHKLMNINPELSAHVDKTALELGEMVRSGKLKKEKFRINLLRAHKKKANQVYIENNVHPGQRVVLIAFQLPFWITMSSSLNNLAIRPYLLNDALVHSQFFTGGAAWFKDLTIPDPYFVMPALFFAAIMSSIKFTELIKNQNRPKHLTETKFEKFFMYFIKAWTVILLGVSIYTPSGCVLYWATSAACGTLHHYVLSYPGVRRVFKIPNIQNDPQPLDWKRLAESMKKLK